MPAARNNANDEGRGQRGVLRLQARQHITAPAYFLSVRDSIKEKERNDQKDEICRRTKKLVRQDRPEINWGLCQCGVQKNPYEHHSRNEQERYKIPLPIHTPD